MKFGLPEKTVSTICRYFESVEGLERVLIYGSRAKGNFRDGSDIDFAVLTDGRDLTGRLLTELDELSTPYMFDVVDYNNIDNPNLREHIDRVGQVFWQRQP
jgi:predicted nucleotidyltransferase